MDLEALKTRICDSLSVDELCDRLNISIEDLVNKFEDQIIDKHTEFYDLE